MENRMQTNQICQNSLNTLIWENISVKKGKRVLSIFMTSNSIPVHITILHIFKTWNFAIWTLFKPLFRFEKPWANERASSFFSLQWSPCEQDCPLMKFHSHEELISDLESIQDLATDQFAEIFCIYDTTTAPAKGKQFLFLSIWK